MMIIIQEVRVTAKRDVVKTTNVVLLSTELTFAFACLLTSGISKRRNDAKIPVQFLSKVIFQTRSNDNK
jgi:hypothetical protein